MMTTKICRVLWLCLALFAVPATAAQGNRRPVVLIVGDSLSAAYHLPSGTGWPDLLQKRLDASGLPYRVVNASRKGATTGDGVRWIGGLVGLYHPAVVVVELGANDGLRHHALEDIVDNLHDLLETARAAGAVPVLVGMRLPPTYPPVYAAGFAGVYADLGATSDVTRIPFLLERVAGRPEYFLPDHLHPNVAGQPLLLDTVWAGLAPLLSAKAALR